VTSAGGIGDRASKRMARGVAVVTETGLLTPSRLQIASTSDMENVISLGE
jgi:hypothetical protein